MTFFDSQGESGSSAVSKLGVEHLVEGHVDDMPTPSKPIKDDQCLDPGDAGVSNGQRSVRPPVDLDNWVVCSMVEDLHLADVQGETYAVICLSKSADD
eukprot:g47211.t1